MIWAIAEYYKKKRIAKNIWRWRHAYGIPTDTLRDWYDAETFINLREDEYAKAGDEFLVRWLENRDRVNI